MRKKSGGGASESQKMGRQTVYQRGSQRDGSPHYVFLYSDEENSGGEEEIPLHPRSQPRSPPRKVEVINIKINLEDSLQALALRYHCTISELKRINNIHKENEIFAHNTIKVPVKPFSFLTETLSETATHQDARVGELVRVQDEPGTSREEQIINLIATPTSLLLPKSDINDTILNSLCEPLPSPGTRDLTEVQNDGESDGLLGCSEGGRSNSPEPHNIDTFKCSGADWGLSWAQLVGCSLLLGFAGPIIYILYLAEYSKHQSTTGH